MSERRTKLWRKEFRKRWKFDADAFIDDVIDLEFKWRLGLCYRVLFKRKSKADKWEIGRWIRKQLHRIRWKEVGRDRWEKRWK